MNMKEKKQNKKTKQNKTGENCKGNFFLVPAAPTFRVPFTFASSPLSENLQQAISRETADNAYAKFNVSGRGGGRQTRCIMGDTQIVNKVFHCTFPRRASHALRPVLARPKDPEKNSTCSVG